VLTAIGTSLPTEHHASCAASYQKPASFLFAVVDNDAASAIWRSDIGSIFLISGRGPTAVWRETDRHGNSITYRTVAYAAGRKLRRAVDFAPGMPFAGTWTYDFSPLDPRATRLTIVEDGQIYNPFFRFMARYAFGYTQSMHAFLADLAKFTHETVSIDCVANP
jgi:hypothetical protein